MAFFDVNHCLLTTLLFYYFQTTVYYRLPIWISLKTARFAAAKLQYFPFGKMFFQKNQTFLMNVSKTVTNVQKSLIKKQKQVMDESFFKTERTIAGDQ